MNAEQLTKALNDLLDPVKAYIDRGFAVVEERLAAIEKRLREADIEAEVQRRLADTPPTPTHAKPVVRVPVRSKAND